MLGRRHEVARMQSDFYRINYHRILRALIVSIIIMVLLICAIIYKVLFVPSERYYATTTQGQIIPLHAAPK
jgi:intracellular multiplication protein IcmL